MAHPPAEERPAAELAVGLTASFERDVTETDILEFARVSGDFNPLHVDGDYAATTPFKDPVAHGAFQVALASAMIGMHLPGLHVLLGSISARFPQPLRYPTRVVVSGEITAWNPTTRGGSLRVRVDEQASGTTTAEVSMSFVMRPEEPQAVRSLASTSASIAPPRADRPVVLVTGAAGGLGAALVEALSADHEVIAQVRRSALAAELAANANVHPLVSDLSGRDWEATVVDALGPRSLHTIVHAAWPEGPRGGLLDAADEAIESQVGFGSTVIVRLARLLAAHGGGDGRLVALGSMWGGHRPSLQNSPYSLGKATLEHCIRLLAPELARKGITINLVSPAFVPVGINARADERQLLMARSTVPVGRLCSTDDVVGAVRYLLSPAASFVSGQTIGLYGGQL